MGDVKDLTNEHMLLVEKQLLKMKPFEQEKVAEYSEYREFWESLIVLKFAQIAAFIAMVDESPR
jgi:hypothetical protein